MIHACNTLLVQHVTHVTRISKEELGTNLKERKVILA